MNICLIQTETHWHDPSANRVMFDEWLRQVPQGCDLVVLPEMWSTGFTMSSSAVAEPMDGATVEWMRMRARSLGSPIAGSVVISEAGAFYNRLICAMADGSVVSYDKRHLFRMANEHEHYTPGNTRVVIDIAGMRVCLMVCYDLRFPVYFRNRGDYDALLVVANWPAARQSAWQTLLRARAIENQSYVIGVNRIGRDGAGVGYAGGSAVYDFAGETRLAADGARGVFNATLDHASLIAARAAFPAWQDADEFQLTP